MSSEWWKNADKQVELRMDIHREVSGDHYGLFFLKVPSKLLKPGEPCLLGVRSIGTNSRRWFGLHPYRDAK